MFLSETLPASHNLLFRVSHPRRKNSCVGPYYEGRTREGSNPVLGPANGAPFITMLSDFFPPFHHLSSFVYFQDRITSRNVGHAFSRLSLLFLPLVKYSHFFQVVLFRRVLLFVPCHRWLARLGSGPFLLFPLRYFCYFDRV
jgi:hypothetical protein